MARPYAVDRRAWVLRAIEAGMSRRAAAAKYEVSISFVVKLMQRWRRHGTVQPHRIGGWERSTLAAHAAARQPRSARPKLRDRGSGEGPAPSPREPVPGESNAGYPQRTSGDDLLRCRAVIQSGMQAWLRLLCVTAFPRVQGLKGAVAIRVAVSPLEERAVDPDRI